MVAKKTGLSPDLIIHPGETILDLLEDRDITQVELAKSTGFTPAYISKVISGKKNISANFAMALEYFFDVPKSFWLNLQANYEAELLEFNEIHSITEDEKKVFKILSQVVEYLKSKNIISSNLKSEETILELRRFFKINNLKNLKNMVDNGAFRISSKIKTNPYVLGAWIKMCQNLKIDIPDDSVFDKKNVPKLVSELKDVMCFNVDHKQLSKELHSLFAKYGIDFYTFINFRGAPVQGYISKTEDGIYKMILTIRQSYADIFWFSLFHELGHIVNGDITGSSRFMDIDREKVSKKELLADEFAKNALLDKKDYDVFLEKRDFSINNIKNFAHSQNVMPFIVIGRLQKEGYLDYKHYSDYKTRYKWSNL